MLKQIFAHIFTNRHSSQYPGTHYLTLSWVGILIFTVVAVLTTIWPDSLGVLNAIVSLVLFGLGCVAFIYAFLISANRSRTELLSVAGIYFLSQSAPKYIAWYFRLQLLLICCIAFTTAGIQPFTALAFGILTPIYVMGLMGLWGAKWGSFDKLRSNDTKNS